MQNTMLGKAPPAPEYFPSKLDQTTVGTASQHSFLIFGREDKHGAPQTSILNAFLRHKVRITSQSGYVDEKLGGYVFCFSCNLKNADISPDGLVVELRELKSVTQARSINMDNRIFEGFFFPLTLLDKRVTALSSGITFLLEERLKTREEKNYLVDVGRLYALGIVNQIRKAVSFEHVCQNYPRKRKRLLQDRWAWKVRLCCLPGKINSSDDHGSPGL
jgi:hypothetical protein